MLFGNKLFPKLNIFKIFEQSPTTNNFTMEKKIKSLFKNNTKSLSFGRLLISCLFLITYLIVTVNMIYNI